MKKIVMFAFLLIFAFSGITAFAKTAEPKKEPAFPDKKENKLTEEEIARLTARVQEIRDMDKSNLTAKEKRELRKELKETKQTMREAGGYIYIGASTLLLIIILIILLT